MRPHVHVLLTPDCFSFFFFFFSLKDAERERKEEEEESELNERLDWANVSKLQRVHIVSGLAALWACQLFSSLFFLPQVSLSWTFFINVCVLNVPLCVFLKKLNHFNMEGRSVPIQSIIGWYNGQWMVHIHAQFEPSFWLHIVWGEDRSERGHVFTLKTAKLITLIE